MKCIRCNQDNLSYHNYCINDGESLNYPNEKLTLKSNVDKYCMECGSHIEEKANYCIGCGKIIAKICSKNDLSRLDSIGEVGNKFGGSTINQIKSKLKNINITEQYYNSYFGTSRKMTNKKNGIMENNSSLSIISLIISILLLIEIFTYSTIYTVSLNQAYHPDTRLEIQILYIIPLIICSTVFILFWITSISKNKYLSLILLSILSGWAPLLLVPVFIDIGMLKFMFSESMLVQLLPFISIAIAVLSNIKYIKILISRYNSPTIENI